MRRSTLDHLVIVSPTLASGAQLIEQELGVQLQPGGMHTRMSTHNLLLRLGESFYLEVIAPDCMAPVPARPRWFGLDGLGADASPFLAHWVARTEHLAAADEKLRKVFGEIEPMSRGALSWNISIQPDGHLPLGGVIPSLIDWGESVHPVRGMVDKGCELQRLEIVYPDPAMVEHHLETIGFSGPVTVLRGERYGLRAYIETPNGLKTL